MQSKRVLNNIVTGLLVTVPTFAFSCESTLDENLDTIEKYRALRQSPQSIEGLVSTRCTVQTEVGVQSTLISKIDLVDLVDTDDTDISLSQLYIKRTTVTVNVRTINRGRFNLTL